MDAIGLVFAGGGGKGAYQIGVWRAVRELQLEQHIAVVAGTSVGALNAALFLKGDLSFAEQYFNGRASAVRTIRGRLAVLQRRITIFCTSGRHDAGPRGCAGMLCDLQEAERRNASIL